jgi:cellulose synthase/poly-beta-1,6-N-acetylglucosamine synthase-like glycosyltransferase
MKYMISVLLPIWKSHPKYLEKSIDSILNQDYDEFELIAIFEKSDNKTDQNIISVLDERKDDHRIRILETKEKGLVNSLNLGLEKSKGEIIARMDSDDIAEKNRFYEQINYLKENNKQLVGTWGYSISQDDSIIGLIKPPVTHSEIRKKIMFHNPFLHPSIIFNKKIINEIGGYNTKFNGAEDYDLYFRILSKGFSVGNVPKFLIKLRETNNSIMRGKNWRKNRKINFQVKKNAVKNLGFCSFRDLIYFSLTPITYLISPKNAFILKHKIGYNKTINHTE